MKTYIVDLGSYSAEERERLFNEIDRIAWNADWLVPFGSGKIRAIWQHPESISELFKIPEELITPEL